MIKVKSNGIKYEYGVPVNYAFPWIKAFYSLLAWWFFFFFKLKLLWLNIFNLSTISKIIMIFLFLAAINHAVNYINLYFSQIMSDFGFDDCGFVDEVVGMDLIDDGLMNY